MQPPSPLQCDLEPPGSFTTNSAHPPPPTKIESTAWKLAETGTDCAASTLGGLAGAYAVRMCATGAPACGVVFGTAGSEVAEFGTELWIAEFRRGIFEKELAERAGVLDKHLHDAFLFDPNGSPPSIDHAQALLKIKIEYRPA